MKHPHRTLYVHLRTYGCMYTGPCVNTETNKQMSEGRCHPRGGALLSATTSLSLHLSLYIFYSSLSCNDRRQSSHFPQSCWSGTAENEPAQINTGLSPPRLPPSTQTRRSQRAFRAQACMLAETKHAHAHTRWTHRNQSCLRGECEVGTGWTPQIPPPGWFFLARWPLVIKYHLCQRRRAKNTHLVRGITLFFYNIA